MQEAQWRPTGDLAGYRAASCPACLNCAEKNDADIGRGHCDHQIDGERR
jgi:hypothetical protein